MIRSTTIALAAALALLGGGPAGAHEEKAGHAQGPSTAYGEQEPFGRVGKTAEAARTVTIHMLDTFRFAPPRLQVRRGETLRLVFVNDGAQKHEWVLGTPPEIAEHAELMRRFPNMEHDAPHMVHVGPGQRREVVWQFNRPGRFQFACLLPGHFEAGMHGFVEVQ